MLDVELSQEEEEWLGENGVERSLPDWRAWKRNVVLIELVIIFHIQIYRVNDFLHRG